MKGMLRKNGYNRRDREGFTFLEVMVALTVLAISLVTLLHTHLLSINLAKETEELNLASMLAQAQMALALAAGFSASRDTGQGEGAYDKFSWDRWVEPTPLEGLKRIKVEVRYIADRQGPAVAELAMYISRAEKTKK